MLGCLRTISQFGIVELGGWHIDLEAPGFDWLADGEQKRQKLAYSQEVVDLLDLAAKIARASGSAAVRVQDLLVAYAGHEGDLMGRLKSQFGFTSAQWRAAVAAIGPAQDASAFPLEGKAVQTLEREYLTPEEAAEILSIHVQTVRGHVRIREASCLATGW